MDANRFVRGEEFCGVTYRPTATCPHCLELSQQPPGPTRVVASVDQDAGTVTIDSQSPREAARLTRLLARPLVKHLSEDKRAHLQALPRRQRRVELAKLRKLAKKGARWVAARKDA